VPDSLDQLFQKDRLSSLWRRYYQLTRPLAYRRYKVYNSHALLPASAKVKTLLRIDSYKVAKSWPFPEILRLHAPYRLYGNQRCPAFLTLDLTDNARPFDYAKTPNHLRDNHNLNRTPLIGPLHRPDNILVSADSFNYSAGNIDRQNAPLNLNFNNDNSQNIHIITVIKAIEKHGINNKP
jgi:hypothetical protein